MTQKDKELLLKDLCARLPYRLKVKCENYSFPVTVLYAGDINEVKFKETGGIEHICMIKPYLFPLSSMTKEQKYEYDELIHSNNIKAIEGVITSADCSTAEIDWLNKNYFDYRGLIPKGLANDATNLNIY